MEQRRPVSHGRVMAHSRYLCVYQHVFVGRCAPHSLRVRLASDMYVVPPHTLKSSFEQARHGAALVLVRHIQSPRSAIVKLLKGRRVDVPCMLEIDAMPIPCLRRIYAALAELLLYLYGL